MIGLRRALWAIAAAGVVFGLVALAVVLGSDHDDEKITHLVFGPLIGWSFIGTGLFAWWRRPDNHFGFLMTSVGFAWMAGARNGLSEVTRRGPGPSPPFAGMFAASLLA